mmetsp:Transcript_70267/g.187145  ORF Transcript_70267/g.187145 Transcript_70267/m.187145 type:complete len:366 (+) Transcript_70267:20-1117(+)
MITARVGFAARRASTGAQHRGFAAVGAANLEWRNLGFDFIPTNGFQQVECKDGQWGEGVFKAEHSISVHPMANVLHYGQSLFEGFKTFHTKDGAVKTFRDDLSYQRMAHGAKRLHMQFPTKEVWESAIDHAIKQNLEYVPPYGTGASLYVRPFLFGSGPKLGLGPSPEYTFCVLVCPVGSYYKTVGLQPVKGLVASEFDRVAPRGIGDCKAAGNYAADLDSMHHCQKMGFPIALYLDSAQHKYVEEFNTSNFVAITKDGKYVTTNSPRTVLNSVTNRSLCEMAEKDFGMAVERRDIDFEAEVDTWQEVGAVGTAVVITPIESLQRGDKVHSFSAPETLQKLHDRYLEIQRGELPDNHGWMRTVVP